MANYTLYGFNRTVKHDICRVPVLSILFHSFSFMRTLKSRVVIMNDKQIIALWLYNRRRKRQQKNRDFGYILLMLEERKWDYFIHYLMTYEMMKISFLIISVCHVLLLMYYMKNSSLSFNVKTRNLEIVYNQLR